MFFKVRYKGKTRAIELKKTGFFSMGFGLMFRTRDTSNLLFDFLSEKRVAITSWFVFFPFLALWIDENFNVIESKIVKPFILGFKPKKNARYLVEVPINHKNGSLIEFFVGK